MIVRYEIIFLNLHKLYVKLKNYVNINYYINLKYIKINK